MSQLCFYADPVTEYEREYNHKGGGAQNNSGHDPIVSKHEVQRAHDGDNDVDDASDGGHHISML